MLVQAHTAEPLPAGCFSLEEVHQLQSTAGRTLTQVSYYLWASAESDAEAGFLYFLELSFDAGPALYLTCGEDSTGIQVSDAAALIETAHQLQALHPAHCCPQHLRSLATCGRAAPARHPPDAPRERSLRQ
ncbi:MAG TPA: hypothetical protein PK858_00460, partial [Saprospiraceae bacterium]|nr:hypothetical protein [Saprospiraceae bacterium]